MWLKMVLFWQIYALIQYEKNRQIYQKGTLLSMIKREQEEEP